MPARLEAPVLSLDAGKMHQIDPANACSLMAMWSMFSKCSGTLKDGRRLENMSWRVWSRESLCVTPFDLPPAAASPVPSLSNSVSSTDSLADPLPRPTESRSRSFGHDDAESASASSLSRSRHLTPHTLEKIMVTIQEKTELCPLSPSIEASLPSRAKTASPPPPPAAVVVQDDGRDAKALQDSTESCLSATTTGTVSTGARQSDHRDSDTSISSDGLIRSGSVVHGFSPAASLFRSHANSLVGAQQPTPPSKAIPKAKSTIKPAMFTLGGSSEDDDSSSFEQRVLAQRLQPQRSSLSQSLGKQNLAAALQPKRTSFRDVVAARRIHEDPENDEGAIASSDDEDDTDDVVESAIDEDEDEDADEWEDSNSDDGKALPEPHLFRRVESRPDLVSRRSMLTLALHRGHGGGGLSHIHSQPVILRSGPASPGKSLAASPEEEDDGMMMHASNRRPIAIPPPSSSKAVAHSPRTTRRNMLSTELTESLRKNLLWERQQKSQAVNAFLQRSRNAQSMANLQSRTAPAAGPSHPAPAPVDTSRNNSWNHYFENPWEYHAKGW